MEPLRRAHRLTRLLLAWFALSLGAAVLALVLHPQHMEVVCSASGSARLIVAGEDPGTVAGHKHTQDCSQCVLAALPPEATSIAVHELPLAQATSCHATAFRAYTASPFEARAPPAA